MSTSTRNKLEEAGFADSRIYSLASAAEKLHSACCPLDSHNLELFTKLYGGPFGIFKFMAAFSAGEHGTRTIEPVKAYDFCESCAEEWPVLSRHEQMNADQSEDEPSYKVRLQEEEFYL